MQNEINHTTGLLTGAVNEEQVKFIKLLFERDVGGSVLEQYLKCYVINRNTRNAAFEDRHLIDQLNKTELLFYDMTELIYNRIESKLTPDKYNELLVKVKELAEELANVKKNWKTQYDAIQEIISKYMDDFEQEPLEALMDALEVDPM